MSRSNQAVQQLKSWLSSCGIPFTINETTFCITSPTGDQQNVTIVAEQTPNQDTMTIWAKEITGRNIDRSITIFHNITQKTGWGTPNPTGRGPAPTRNLSFNDEFELVAMRHKDLHRSPNPAAGQLEKHDRMLEKICWSFFRLNTRQLTAGGIEHADLMQYARLYTTIFLGLYWRSDLPEDDNKRLLTSYIKQRLVEFREVLSRKIRNCLPEKEAAHLGTFGDLSSYIQSTRADRMEDALDAHRHQSPQALKLSDMLNGLSHNRMVTILQNAATDQTLDEDAQQEAGRRLAQHAKDCLKCRSAAQQETATVRPQQARRPIKNVTNRHHVHLPQVLEG